MKRFTIFFFLFSFVLLVNSVSALTAASVNSLSFSSDGLLLASGSADKTIKLWDAKNGSLVRTLTGHTDAVYSVAFSPDGSVLASGSEDGAILFWDAGKKGQPVNPDPGNGSKLATTWGSIK